MRVHAAGVELLGIEDEKEKKRMSAELFLKGIR